MTDFAKSLEDSVDKDRDARTRVAILENFRQNPKSTLEDLFNVCENSKLGPLMKTITLEEIFSAAPQPEGADDDVVVTPVVAAAAATPAPRRAKKAAKKKAAKKTATAAKPKATKKAAKAAPKKAAKKKAAKKAAPKKAKANGATKAKAASAAGGRKARQDYDQLGKEVVAYMGKQGPISTGDLSKKFNISGSQARKVCDLLVGQKLAKRLGKGGRGVKYEAR